MVSRAHFKRTLSAVYTWWTHTLTLQSRFIPENGAPTSVSTVEGYGKGAPSAPSLHDSIREQSVRSIASEMNGKHPLQNRLEKWEETQLDFKLDSYRRTYGAGEPIRRAMELEITKTTTFAPQVLGGNGRSLHQDILEGRDSSFDWEEVYNSGNNNLDFHSELEKRMNL